MGYHVKLHVKPCKTIYILHFSEWPKISVLTLAKVTRHFHLALNQMRECMMLKSMSVFRGRLTKISAAPFECRLEKAFESSMRTAVPLFGFTAPNVHES